jgi:uncharacterized protein YkwD
MKNITSTVFAAAVSILLAACGGGGGSSSSPAPGTPVATTPPAPTAPVVTPADLQTSVPALTYAVSSPEFEFVTAFNAFRKQVGLGLVAQNTALDQSARNHLQYITTNDVLNGGTVDMRANDAVTGQSMFHIEQTAKPGFTGVQAFDRAKAAGYAGSYVGEEISFGGGKGGKVAFESLVRTIYHRAGLMLEGPRDLGVAMGTDLSQTVTFEFGYTAAQSNASDFVGVYPSDGQTAVGRFTGVESPNPFPDLSTSNDDFPTKTGYPVSVLAKAGAVLEVTSFTITEAGATAPLDARLLTKGNDPQHRLEANTAFLVAKSTLKASTTYSVAFVGKVNNVALNKNWKFTTGQ